MVVMDYGAGRRFAACHDSLYAPAKMYLSGVFWGAEMAGPGRQKRQTDGLLVKFECTLRVVDFFVAIYEAVTSPALSSSFAVL